MASKELDVLQNEYDTLNKLVYALGEKLKQNNVLAQRLAFNDVYFQIKYVEDALFELEESQHHD